MISLSQAKKAGREGMERQDLSGPVGLCAPEIVKGNYMMQKK
jgi:hypothetical protein